MHFILALALAIVGWPVAAAPDPVASKTSETKTKVFETKIFETWTATCDNLHDCVAIASSDDGDGLFYLKISRGAAVDAPAEVKIVLAASDPIPVLPSSFALVVKGTGEATFHVAAEKDDADGAAIAAIAADPAFLATIARAQTLDYAAGAFKGRLGVSDLAAALRFIDERQGRLGTPTALIARGMTPIGQVPAKLEPPMVQGAPFVATVIAAPTLGRALLDMVTPICDPEVVEAHGDVAAWMLGPDRELVAVPCTEGATNLSSAMFVTNAKGEEPRPAMLEQPPKQGDAEPDNIVVNYGFDVRTLTLSSLDKGRGLGDCGSMSRWVWTGEIFALLRAARLEACPGALPEDWPTIYQAARK